VFQSTRGEILRGTRQSQPLASGGDGETVGGRLEEASLGIRAVDAILSDLVVGVVLVPQLLESLDGGRANLNGAGTRVVKVNRVAGAEPFEAVAAHVGGPAGTVIAVKGEAALVVAGAGLGGQGDAAPAGEVPLVKEELLGEAAVSRVHGHGARRAGHGALEGISGGLLHIGIDSGAVNNVRGGGKEDELARVQAGVDGLDQLVAKALDNGGGAGRVDGIAHSNTPGC